MKRVGSMAADTAGSHRAMRAARVRDAQSS